MREEVIPYGEVDLSGENARPRVDLPLMAEADFEAWVRNNASAVEERKNVQVDLGNVTKSTRTANYVHGYKNYLTVDKISWCGQAAVATIWDWWGYDPGYAGQRVVTDPHLPGLSFWHDVTIVDQIVQRFPNDVIGASPNRLCDAFIASGFVQGWGWGPLTTYETIAPYLDRNIPVICLIKWGSDIKTLHWVCVYRLSDGMVWFTNPAHTSINNYNDPAQLSAEGWRVGGLSYEDFGNRWSWTGLTKCHIVAGKGA